ncbi:hypothetical protein B0T21DRAFT_378864 [Apiosordaria backusii]|uniref:Uncharacterized protein n=1 Tax=Apiosordaria backusii TaxID=314023 RepID=A0AA39ZPY8_9PEZI|nr:hypothetical protein B0T21DRAFT_378864 [Apiosordaria backusii]
MLRLPQRTAAFSRLSKSGFEAPLIPHASQTRSIQQQFHQQNNPQSSSKTTPPTAGEKPPPDAKENAAQLKKKKTLKELDEELRLKMEGLSGEGGASGVEYEDGKAVAMKRGVRDNMFRYI